ncbi:trimeric virion coat protein [Western grey kangaroopox virus]|uniref:62 kDa protein n=1 Tax=Western grey kangaroopox virus TaxID=1566307 RepID=A0A2C9DSQ2_9POXV|nr:trimeric virion coat protein [Western grey kangaroopox virus]ATI21035.1 trimeric virion coat protein [Western grey kangaroopox virus]
MNNSIINSIINSNDVVRRSNVFGLDIQQPTLYMPQYISVSGISQPDDGCSASTQTVIAFDIRDQYITALNHLVLSLELPEVKGVGRFAYAPYVGYKCIRHVAITSEHGTVWECDGEDLFDKCSGEDIAAMAGRSRELNDISSGVTPNDTIKEAATVHVYLKTPFDADKTFSSLKLSDCKLTVTVTFRPITEAIIYDQRFAIDQFLRDFVYVADLSFVGYMVRDVRPKTAYVEMERRVVSCANIPTSVVSDVHACTGVAVYVKPCYGATENRFVSYPGFAQTESDYVRAFVDRLLEDLVVIADAPPDWFPKSAHVVKVPRSGVVSIQDADAVIRVDNVPEGKDVYYHTNLMIFSTRKNSFIYNISKKFSAIVGTYSPATNRILFSQVNHSVSVADASIPVGFWTSPRNIYSGDNRSEASRARDLFVNDPFLKGVDMINKTDVISRLEVRFGNDVMYSETAPISKVYNALLQGQSNVRKLIFNLNPVTFFKPTTLTANVARGKDKINVRVLYAGIDPNNPLHYVAKQLVVVCTDLYRVDYDRGIRVSKISE